MKGLNSRAYRDWPHLPVPASGRYDLLSKHVSRPTLRIVSPSTISLSIGGVEMLFMRAGWRHIGNSLTRASRIVAIHIPTLFSSRNIHQQTDFALALPFPSNKFGRINLPAVQLCLYLFPYLFHRSRYYHKKLHAPISKVNTAMQKNYDA